MRNGANNLGVLETLGLGGGCHWCTEAVFLSLRGVHRVRSGWITPEAPDAGESEAVLIDFDPDILSLIILLDIHIVTHASGSDHSMRDKYRSAVYTTSETQAEAARLILKDLRARQDETLITQVLPFGAFRKVGDNYDRYYDTDPTRPFCITYINPKIEKLIAAHRQQILPERLTNINDGRG